jgi:hypothetical protein
MQTPERGRKKIECQPTAWRNPNFRGLTGEDKMGVDDEESLEDDEAQIVSSPDIRRRRNPQRDDCSPSPSCMKINFRDEGEFYSP